MSRKPEHDIAAASMGNDRSPLLPQVREILIRQGYRPVVGSALYQRVSSGLADAFFEVTKDGVQPYGVVPRPPKETHMAFVARHARYLFK